MDPFATELNLLFMHTYRYHPQRGGGHAQIAEQWQPEHRRNARHRMHRAAAGTMARASPPSRRTWRFPCPPATVAVKKLEKKGFVLKSRGARKHGRRVLCATHGNRPPRGSGPPGIFTGKRLRGRLPGRDGRERDPRCWARYWAHERIYRQGCYAAFWPGRSKRRNAAM